MKNKSTTILITGAANGIGLAITNYLIEKGVQVVAADYDKKSLEQFEGKQNIIPIFMDVTKVETIENVLSQLTEKIDGLDCIINNAGIFVGGSLLDVDLEELAHLMNINVLGYARVTKIMFPLLKKNKSKIINISSEVGRFSFPFNGPYSMSKFAVESFSDSLRRELMFLGIKVVVIQPGGIRTPLTEKTMKEYKKYRNKKYIFSDQINRLWPILEKQKFADPIHVAKKVFKILKKNNPRRRYRIKNNQLRRILEFLPTSWVDFLIKHVM
ncbi:MAG: SDR family oxidoreductase [Candidatus Heimdallarchaeota archaeon]|nr:SDR family oxidoreductase [Candidatus Heimdallarchaeota archaeon]MCK4954338.1 SDR family oxidoreductase [Candidatus Heimdallarchaeota archaeon]